MTALFAAAYINSNAIEVGEQQLPDIHRAVQTCCERLGILEPVAVYVLQENLWNAFAAKLAPRRVVVLLSGALDSILLKGDMNQSNLWRMEALRKATFVVGMMGKHQAVQNPVM